MSALSSPDPGLLSLVDVPAPEPGPTEVLVRVRVAGINPVDWKTRQGAGVRGFFDASSPMVLGWDVAGEVVEVGAGVTRFSVGDRVFAEVATEMDAVLDFVGGPENPSRSLASLRRGGRLVVIPSPAELPGEEALAARGVTANWLLVEPDHAGLEALARMLEAGTLKVLIAASKPLAEMAALHVLSESSAVTGKLIATI